MLIDETTSVRIYDHPSPMLRIDTQWFNLEQAEYDRLNELGQQEELAYYRGEGERREAVRREFRQRVQELLDRRELQPVEWEPMGEGSNWSKIKGTEFKLSLSKAKDVNG